MSKEIYQMIAIKLPLRVSGRLSPAELKSPCSANRKHLRLQRREGADGQRERTPAFPSSHEGERSGKRLWANAGETWDMRGEGLCSLGTREGGCAHCPPT